MFGITNINHRDVSFVAVIIIALCEFLRESRFFFSCTWNHLQATFVTLPTNIDCWQPSTWGMTILYSDHSLPCSYWLLHACAQHNIFHPWYVFQPLVTFRHLPVIPVWLVFSSRMPAMPLQALKGSEQDQFHIFLSICFWNFRMHLLIRWYHSVHTDHYISLDFVVQSLPILFLFVCSKRLWCSSSSGCCRIPSLWIMTFHWIFTSHLCNDMDKHFSAELAISSFTKPVCVFESLD